MSGLDPDELKLLEETMAKVLESSDRLDMARLDELGWFELWRDQPAEAARALFGQQGRLARTSPVLSVLMGAALLGDPAAPPVLLPEFNAFAAGWCSTRSTDGALTALAQADALADDGQALFVAGCPSGDNAQLLRVEVAALRRTPVDGLDPALRLCAVDVSAAVRSGTPLMSGTELSTAWAQALALGRRLLAEEMVGVVAEQLRLAVEHATSRSQFGRPIGSFQAVKHKLAEVYVALSVARLAADEAWLDPAPTTCLMAKVLAGVAVETASQHCQQVLGGIGFTWEHPFHHYLRRGRLLAALLGSRAQLAASVGSDILDARRTPVLAPL
ncbi:acyl-CoA dehydrogenase family protein [Pseudonocardia spinosispora]|uniref:acyl-CoA dehydrogenase family protein n=1 Tax=Pseudonocardia spinosispora TaxID=103441 RepID=UPI0004023D3C|nr:acyl-CoA dehydrogenase family protein [Pseudonocardia spinosispora]